MRFCSLCDEPNVRTNRADLYECYHCDRPCPTPRTCGACQLASEWEAPKHDTIDDPPPPRRIPIVVLIVDDIDQIRNINWQNILDDIDSIDNIEERGDWDDYD
jgi:hypothetical protein